MNTATDLRYEAIMLIINAQAHSPFSSSLPDLPSSIKYRAIERITCYDVSDIENIQDTENHPASIAQLVLYDLSKELKDPIAIQCCRQLSISINNP